MTNPSHTNPRPPNLPRRESGEEPSGDSYDALISAARRLIGSMGYQKVTVDDVRKEAGVSRATFYFYFKNKRHLFTQMARSVMDDMYEVAGRHYPERDEYTRIILANIAYLEVWRREAKIMGEFFTLSLVDEEISAAYQRYRERFESGVACRHALIDGRVLRIPLLRHGGSHQHGTLSLQRRRAGPVGILVPCCLWQVATGHDSIRGGRAVLGADGGALT
ncbi:TetR/AcrR family transcriptional regulator [bacterium]|nr:TetR/AcrR family transcriptional regulator [bacterium]